MPATTAAASAGSPSSDTMPAGGRDRHTTRTLRATRAMYSTFAARSARRTTGQSPSAASTAWTARSFIAIGARHGTSRAASPCAFRRLPMALLLEGVFAAEDEIEVRVLVDGEVQVVGI